MATSTIFNVLIGSKKQKSIKKTTPVTRSSLKKLFQSNQTSSQSSKGNRNLKQPPCSSSCKGHTLAIKPLHLTNQPVATSTIFNVLVDSQKQRSTSIKKSTPVSRSSLKKLFQSNQTSPQNSEQIQSLETDLTDSHSEAHPCNAELLKHMDPASASDSENDNDDYTYYGKDSDSVSSSSNDSMPSDSDKPDCIEDYSHPEYARLLPFPNVSCEWYKRQRDLELHNVTREQHRRRNAAQVDSKGAVLFVDRSQVKGELADNIRSLREQAEKSQDGSKTHLLSLVAVGEFIMQNGPVVKTQEAGKVYNSKKGLVQRKYSIEFYEVFSKHLNLAQIYMFKTAYLTRNSSNLTGVINSLSSMLDSDDIVKSVVEDRLKEMFPTILKYLDSHRDRQVLKALVAEVTSTSFTAKLQGLKSRKGTRNAKISLSSHLLHYSNIRATSQVVRNDMTNAQQHNLTERIISAIKLKKIKTIGEGRGRKLKTVQFPELATVLSYAFGEFDGGTEAHPRLTTGTMYRASDNATTMKQAREVLLSLAPEGFKISLSSCFNYTENYRKGSIQSKQHHVGKDVNASLSLKKPPRTGVQHLVVNLHWSTANVNLLVDSCHNMPHCLVVSKDAKAIIPTDIAPVQHPGHSWKQRLELPDHTWDQSRTNAITPMTFLFLLTRVEQLPATSVNVLDLQVSDTTMLHLTRSGQSVTLLNLSFFEPDTTFKCLNEICYLLSMTELDTFFRDPSSQKLKKEWVFVVDNGPAEQPSSHLVQMCLARLLHFLTLDKITQISFAEYHSKRNFVERVHAEENRVLSKHGPFKSRGVHQQASPGSIEHKENMEFVADEVCKCIKTGSFGGSSLLCFRGVQPKDCVFSDEVELQNFLSLSEEAKELFSPSSYSVVKGNTLTCISFFWDLESEFQGNYITDYKTIHNTLLDDVRTAWTDKYTTSLYSLHNPQCRRYELQPVPDYLRWYKTGELHYLPLEERSLLKGPWDEIPGAYLPSRILDLCLSLLQELTEELVAQISLLSWVTPSEVREYKKKLDNQYEQQLKSEREKNKWKKHSLYRNKTKPQLESMCRKLRIPVTSSLLKHQLVSLVSQKSGESAPPDLPHTLYCGKLQGIPTSVTKIGNTMTIPYLRSILKYHQLPFSGSKDQLVMRVYLLRHNKSAAAATKEVEQLRDLINLAYATIREQRRLCITEHIYRKRKYSLQKRDPHFITKPRGVQSQEDLQALFQPLLMYITTKQNQRKLYDESLAFRPQISLSDTPSDNDVINRLTQTGAKVKIKWTSEEIGSSGWKVGWYVATVHSYCTDADLLTLTYQAEPNVPYNEELTPLIARGKIKPLWSPL